MLCVELVEGLQAMIVISPAHQSKILSTLRPLLERVRWLAGFAALVASGCAAGDEANGDEPEDEVLGALSQAITSSELVGYWERHPSSSGRIRYVELTSLAAPSGPGEAPAGYRSFVMRIENSGQEFVAAYQLSSPTTLRVVRWGQNPGPPAIGSSQGGDFRIVSSNLCNGCISLEKPGYTTVLRKVQTGAAPFVIDRMQQRVVIVTPDSVERAATEVVDYAAMELRRHLELVLGGTHPTYPESALIGPTAPGHRRIYVGKTLFAHKLGIAQLATEPESWVDYTLGQSIVLYGPESGKAAMPSSMPWSNGGLKFTAATRPFHFEIHPGHELLSKTQGGTVEFWIQDNETGCTPETPGACGKGGHLFTLESRHESPGGRLGILAQHLTGGLFLDFFTTKVRPGESADANRVAPSEWKMSRLVPRDGAMHHVTVSIAPCESGVGICGKSWMDGQDEVSFAFPETSAESLDLTADWDQHLWLDAGDSALNVTLRGLRIADRPTTQEEHAARHDVTSIDSIATGDTFLMNLKEGSGLPVNKSNTAFLLVPPAPSVYGERGTLHAVHAWVQRVLGVRWYMPGKLGTAYAALSRAEVPRVRYVLRNPLRYRYMLPVRHLTPPLHVSMTSPGETFEPAVSEQYQLRVGIGGDDVPINHSLYEFRDRFKDSFPDWFSDVGYQQPCLANPALYSQLRLAVTEYAARPDGGCDGGPMYSCTESGRLFPLARNGYFALAPLDGDVFWRPYGSDDCNYGNALSRGLVNPNFPPGDFVSGEASEYVFDLYNRLARDAASAAGRPVKIAGLAYMDHAFPPDRPIEHNLVPTLAFELRGWNTPAGGMSRTAFSRWADKDTPDGFMGWTYLFDSRHGEYELPSFDFRNVASAAREVVARHRDQFAGLKFEHSTSIHPYSAYGVLQNPDYQNLVSDFDAFVDVDTGEATLRDRWPLSVGLLGYIGPQYFFRCGGEGAAGDSQVDAYDPYCARYNETIVANAPLISNIFELWHDGLMRSRGAPSALLDRHFVLREMSTPVAVAGSSAPPALDVEAELTRYFNNYYEAGALPMRAAYGVLSSIRLEHDVGCPPAGNSREWALCQWPRRLSKTIMDQAHAHLQVARSRIGASKRFRAFERNVWCTLVRGFYEYVSANDRANDTYRSAEVCAEANPEILLTYEPQGKLDRFVAE